MFFENQLQAQRQYQEREIPPEIILNKMITHELTNTQIAFIESCHFCFIASSNRDGECDCSFRGSDLNEQSGEQSGEQSALSPLLKVINPNTLHMPDFAGNGLFDSVGNFLDNPNIGMIFIDFEQSIRLRVNGQVEIKQPNEAQLTIWPNAKRIIEITTTRCFFNCNKRIKQSFERDLKN